jgi:small-conductance mechanosensitive channel
MSVLFAAQEADNTAPINWESAFTFAEMLGTTIVIVVGAMLVYLFASKGLGSVQKRGYLPPPLVATLRGVLRWTAVVAGILLVLQSWGVLGNIFVALTTVLALVAIGFVAVWSILSNALCSLILIVARPFRVGDTLEFPPDGIAGKVVNFNLLFTTLQTDDGSFLQVPNNVFFQRIILRKPGEEAIDLDRQLYEEENAEVR